MYTYINSRLFPMGVGRNYKTLLFLYVTTLLASFTFIHLTIGKNGYTLSYAKHVLLDLALYDVPVILTVSLILVLHS